jgi:predicted transcriptional regulator
MSNAKLFDTLRERFKIPSDSALADELELSASDICRYRAGRALSSRAILSVHEHLGLPVAEIRALAAETAPQQ